MKKIFFQIFIIAMMHAMCTIITAADFKIVGYYSNWSIYSSKFNPRDIDGKLLTHINYAFAKPDAQGNVVLFDSWADTGDATPYAGNFKQLDDLKKKFPHLKTLISIGGWTLSANFPLIAADSTMRANFVKQAVKFCEMYNFNGIDIDWEFPGPADKANYTAFLKELYAAAKAHNPALLVTIAAPAGQGNLANIELEKIQNYVDWINIMAYDFHGPWGEPITNHNAPLYKTAQGDPTLNDDSAVTYYLTHNVPSNKIVLGLPLYGRSFAGTSGLYSAYSGPGSGTTEPGIRFFWDIKQNLLNSFTRSWDDTAKVPYLYNASKREFVSYDDEESLRLKCQYIKSKGLGGVMVWELVGDVRPSWDAMTAIKNELTK